MFLSLGMFVGAYIILIGAYNIFCGALLKTPCEDLRSSLLTLSVLSLSCVLDLCKAFNCGNSQLESCSYLVDPQLSS